MIETPLLELVAVSRHYDSDAGTVRALDEVNLTIGSGEMLAIMGPSGSGKSTLMNILGCLDVPTGGRYRVAGVDVATLNGQALAKLRRERFGFVFQRYHLLPQHDALGNVELPAIYAGMSVGHRRRRALELLARLGMSDRSSHRPSALSGGQQQRISIARALMNGASVLLADEPTGALDSRTGAELLALLHDLHAQGHTIVLVTHDAEVAAHASRIVELHDGRVVRDGANPSMRFSTANAAARLSINHAGNAGSPLATATRLRPLAQFKDAVTMAVDALRRHRLRSALSMLGISIGIAAVVSTVALGDAVRGAFYTTFSDSMAGQFTVWRGAPDRVAGAYSKPFDENDIKAVRALGGVERAVPQLQVNLTARHASRNAPIDVVGAEPGDVARSFARILEGRDITNLDLERNAQVALVSVSARVRLFTDGASPVGKTLIIDTLPFEVVGLMGPPDGFFSQDDYQERAYIPVSTYRVKIGNRAPIEFIRIWLSEHANPDALLSQVKQVLKVRHGTIDFNIVNLQEDYRKMQQFNATLQGVLSAIAAISLMVGGVGVMNIMLVAVSERTQEIGIRIAVGARPLDVQLQFLVEALVLCALGGAAGIVLFGGLAAIANWAQKDLHFAISWAALAVAFIVSSAIGLSFGFLPARTASRLNPVAALARE